MAENKYNMYDAIRCPNTNQKHFAIFPCIELREHSFPEAPIFLYYGDRRFGVEHIWRFHRYEITALKSFKSLNDDAIMVIARYVGAVLQPGVQIFCEFAELKGNPRTTVFKGRAGLVVLEQREAPNGEPYYSVVTAFPGKANGTLIGAI